MRLVKIATTFLIVSGATSAYAQTRAASAACNLPHESGVSAQQLMSGQRQRGYRLFVPA
jgi:hypothetical protein